MPPIRRCDALGVELEPCGVRRDETLNGKFLFVLETLPALTVADATYKHYDARGQMLVPFNGNGIPAVQAIVEILAWVARSVPYDTFLKGIVLGVLRSDQMVGGLLVLVADPEGGIATNTPFLAVYVGPLFSHCGLAAGDAS